LVIPCAGIVYGIPFEHTRRSIAVGGDWDGRLMTAKIPLLLVVARAPTRRRVWASDAAGPVFALIRARISQKFFNNPPLNIRFACARSISNNRLPSMNAPGGSCEIEINVAKNADHIFKIEYIARIDSI
jgi:hypothetical protein